MFTIKATKDGRTIIRSAESFTILHESSVNSKPTASWTEISLHNGDDGCRLDVGASPYGGLSDSHIGVFDVVYIMNDKGKTIETITYGLRA